MKLSVVLISWNGRAFLERCLRSLSFLDEEETEIIVVDNGSRDGTGEMVARDFPRVLLLTMPENKGVSYARNRGLERTSGDYIWILDNDTEVSSETTQTLLNFMDRHPRCGLCACRLMDADGLVQESCKVYPGLWQKIRNLLHPHGYRYVYGLRKMQKAFEPDYLIGACQMVRRKAFEQVGLLDEHIFYGPEDADFCLRIRAAGWYLQYLPQVSILHNCQRASRKHLFSRLALTHTLSLFYFYRKHKRLF